MPDQWWGAFAIWKGGLGVWGGIAAGCIVGAIVAKRAGADVALLADCLAPGLLVAQAVGRIGNWWNQELFGKPTGLPWGLEIDPVHRPLASIDHATYHPAFLYEIIWNLSRRPPSSSTSSSGASTRGRRACSRSTSLSTRSGASGSS